MLGSDIVRYNPYLKVMQNPMKDKNDPVVFIPALYPDVAIIHCHAADKYGNAYIYGPAVNDLAVAAATRKLIITAEEIVPENTIRYSKEGRSFRSFMPMRLWNCLSERFPATCPAVTTGRGSGGKN
jgi:acyl CoA:acetate/3-ketoacid CoA transferase alpha subunit